MCIGVMEFKGYLGRVREHFWSKMDIFNISQHICTHRGPLARDIDDQLSAGPTYILTHLLTNCCPDVIDTPQDPLEPRHFLITTGSELAQVTNWIKWYQVYNLSMNAAHKSWDSRYQEKIG